jgi:hypothetical protein
MDKIDWYFLSGNHYAIHLLEQNVDNIRWDMLSTNIHAVRLLEDNLDKICWDRLLYNDNPRAFEIIERNIDFDDSIPLVPPDYPPKYYDDK